VIGHIAGQETTVGGRTTGARACAGATETAMRSRRKGKPLGTIGGPITGESPVIAGNRIQTNPLYQAFMRKSQTIAMQKVVGSSPISRFG
jgi:hypothetical protein